MIRLLLLLVFITNFSFVSAQTWTSAQLEKANTAKNSTYLTEVEKETILYINLCRLYPKDFLRNELMNYYGTEKYGDYVRNSTYRESLIKLLGSMQPVNALYFDMNDPEVAAYRTMWVYWNSGGTPYSALSRSGTYGDYNDNTWRNYCFVRNNSDASVTKHYMNGAERTTGVTRAGTQTTQFGNGAGYNINIGRFHTGGSFFAGNVAIFQVYNRVLTDTEISQNFNAFRERFNI